MPVMTEQILLEKIRVIDAPSDKNDEGDYLQPLKQFLWKGLQVARKSDRRTKNYGKFFLVDILII